MKLFLIPLFLIIQFVGFSQGKEIGRFNAYEYLLSYNENPNDSTKPCNILVILNESRVTFYAKEKQVLDVAYLINELKVGQGFSDSIYFKLYRAVDHKGIECNFRITWRNDDKIEKMDVIYDKFKVYYWLRALD